MSYIVFNLEFGKNYKFFVWILGKKALEKSVKMNQTPLFDPKKLVFQKLNAIMNPEVYIIIGSLKFHLKVNERVTIEKIQIF